MKQLAIILTIAVWLLGSAVYATDLTSAHFIVRDPSIGTGGGYQSSGSYNLYSAGNLNVSGSIGNSTDYVGRAGFLQYPEADASPLAAVATGSEIDVSWSATSVADGYTVSG
jgi:hypothetical protein